MNKKDLLKQRLIRFAVMIIELVESMPDAKSANHLGGQILRSGTVPALNCEEAQKNCESPKDFIHKIKIVAKELRESFVCLQIIHQSGLFASEEELQALLKESNEIISIFVKSAATAERNIKAQLEAG
jgi:four helix bundle protein